MFLERLQPRKDKPSQVDNIKRLLIDRFVFTPPFIALFLFVVTMLEVRIQIKQYVGTCSV